MSLYATHCCVVISTNVAIVVVNHCNSYAAAKNCLHGNVNETVEILMDYAHSETECYATLCAATEN